MKEKIKFFPITSFAIVMGLLGLTIVFGKFYHLQWLPKYFYSGSLFLTTILFFVLFVMYGLKIILYFDEAKKDFLHRIRINFFSAISISLLLLSIAYYTFWPILGLILWWVGVLLHTWLMFKTIAFWIQHNFEISHFNPAWFIPVVGNILIPIVGVDLMPVSISYFYFVIGLLFWVVLFTIFLYRVIFHDQLPKKFVPTFFILLAPPAVGFISYIRITQSWDNLSTLLLFLTFFFLIMLIFLYKSFKELKFFVSWWAFTFPLAASTIASIVAYQITHTELFKYLAWLLLVSLLTAVIKVGWTTLKYLGKGEICIEEE